MAQDARVLLQHADKVASSAGSGFSLFGGQTNKWENAADLYMQAANSFRMSNQLKEAGQAFEKVAGIQTKDLHEPDDAANTLIEAFKVYRKSEPQSAARCADIAINRFAMTGSLRRAATHAEKLGELYEIEIGDQKKALQTYEIAAGWFESDNADASANKLYLKVAELAALDSDYYKAVENFEKVASSALSNNLMKWSLKEYFLKSGMCLLALGDMVDTNRALKKYTDMDPTFPSTREYQLLVDLTEAVSTGDSDTFENKIFHEFDQLGRLDTWKTAILTRIKKDIETQGEDFS